MNLKKINIFIFFSIIFQFISQYDSFAFFSEFNRLERHLSKKIIPSTSSIKPSPYFNYKPHDLRPKSHPKFQKIREEYRIARVMRDRGNVIKVHQAENINQSFDPTYVPPPFKKATNVIEFKSHPELNLIRVHIGDKNKIGRWATEKNEIQGQTPKNIRKTLALPQEPTHQSDVTVPAGTHMYFGYVEPHPKYPNEHTAIQYFIKDRLHQDMFKNTRPISDEVQEKK